MTNAERVDFLIHELMSLQPGYPPDIPEDCDGKRRLLRSLMNTCPPSRFSPGFWQAQDDLLQSELAEKEVTLADSLPPVAAHSKISLWRGDITTLRADAIVNAANSALLGCFVPCHRCIDNAIHSAAGLQLRMECDELMRRQGNAEPTGGAKITEAYNLPCCRVLHTVGPIISGLPTEREREQLASCYRSCLALAEESNIKSVAFCCISTGEFRFPQELAAGIAINTVTGFLSEERQIQQVIFNVFMEKDYAIYRGLLGADR